MSSAEKPDFINAVDYLAAECQAESKHEYVDGWVRAMAGASNRHNLITSNAQGSLWIQLKRKPCQAFNSDTKIRIQRGLSTWFYYPDALVVCDENSQNDSYQQSPVLVIEVLSRSTRSIDLDEKLNNYLLIPSLQYCLLLEQVKPRAILMRRTDAGFLRETFEGMEAAIPLEAIQCNLRLSDLYDRVDFSPESLREEIADYVTE